MEGEVLADHGKRYVDPFLKKEGVSQIDVMILTHPHDDHLAGLLTVLDNIKTLKVLDPSVPHTAKKYYKFLQKIYDKGISYETAREGMMFESGDGLFFQILHPVEKDLSGLDLNNSSIVIKLTYKDFSAIFTGDAEEETEKILLSKYSKKQLKSDLLKVGHHGSKTSSSQSFLNAVSPKIAFISLGSGNKYNHPHKETLLRLQNIGAKVYRTDIDGTITLYTDGVKYLVDRKH